MAAYLPASGRRGASVHYYAPGSGDYYLYTHLRRVLGAALAATRLSRRGIAPADIDRLLRPVEIRFFAVGAQPGRADYFGTEWCVLALACVLLFSFISHGAMVMQSAIEEKLSRIAELLLVSTRPEELMAGKILGAGAVGLSQIAIWLALGGGIARRPRPGARRHPGNPHPASRDLKLAFADLSLVRER